MANVQLAHAGQPRHRLDIEIVQSVAGIEPHAKRADRLAGGLNPLEFLEHRKALGIASLGMERMRVRAGVNLAYRGADAFCGFYLAQLRIDEHRHDNPRSREAVHRLAEKFFLGGDIEAAFGCHLVAALWNQHRHLRTYTAGDLHHLGGSRHFQVELDVRELPQPTDVGVLDVAPVLAQVHRDAVGAAQMRLYRSPYGVGLVGAPRLPYGGHVVDIHAELDHRSFNSFSTARVCSTCPCRRCAISARSSPRAWSRVSARP